MVPLFLWFTQLACGLSGVSLSRCQGAAKTLETLAPGDQDGWPTGRPAALQHPGAGDRGPLCRLPHRAGRRRDGLLSAFVDQAPDLQQALAAAGWRAELSAQQGRWALLVLHKAH
jgi:hypothetical protein